MYYIYILLCKDGKLYKGCTANLKKRIADHHQKRVKSTKNKLPIKLIYYAGFKNKTDALREELFLKSGKGKEQLKLRLLNTLKAGVAE